MADASVCTNCGAELAPEQRYCGACGQKRIDDADRRLPALVRSSLEEVTDLDGRLLPSLWALIARPGRLSREYRLGRRRRYLSPISLFLLANLAFFLAPTISDLNIDFYDQYTIQIYSDWMRPHLDAAIVDRIPEDAEITEPRIQDDPAFAAARKSFAADYDARIGDIAKSMVIAHVPALALGTLLLTFWRRLLYADHVVTMLHFFTFVMLYYTLMPFTVIPVLRALDALPFWDVPIWSIAMTLKFIYLPFMFRTAFDLRWYAAVPVSIVFLGVLLYTHLGYRLLQLWIGLAIV